VLWSLPPYDRLTIACYRDDTLTTGCGSSYHSNLQQRHVSIALRLQTRHHNPGSWLTPSPRASSSRRGSNDDRIPYGTRKQYGKNSAACGRSLMQSSTKSWLERPWLRCEAGIAGIECRARKKQRDKHGQHMETHGISGAFTTSTISHRRVVVHRQEINTATQVGLRQRGTRERKRREGIFPSKPFAHSGVASGWRAVTKNSPA